MGEKMGVGMYRLSLFEVLSLVLLFFSGLLFFYVFVLSLPGTVQR